MKGLKIGKMKLSESTQRIHWIDIVKGMGIYLVVLGHIYRSNPVLIWICSFHMPLFFILSGWLRGCERKQVEWGRFIRKKCESFIVPLLEFLLITFFYWIIVERYFREFGIGPMWFLPALFFAEVVAEIIIDYMDVKFVWGGECFLAFYSTFVHGLLTRIQCLHGFQDALEH